ncbi:NADH-ubiquinone oxidoreductase chain C [Methylophaga frappieri]|uniref:NADH-quinone oxidoreductase subunit C n=1 Tax=Methylophaga frappieri (strain ATCC BAA-2434 / DSM 25690 / JAM7) TaxID=754477 RepID=I1YHG7_METFJ|nr:NADH-quinone oxidoreductase subunit C [Methylophaga frappieri]AFJ02360.1 NADH-ubiquinone oxidoreductase chain C [Methylophaga frappieri]
MIASLKATLQQAFAEALVDCEVSRGELTLYLEADQLCSVCTQLRDEFGFTQLIDLCGVDYVAYGDSGWETKQASEHGFSRAREPQNENENVVEGYRFAVVYHLLSVRKNQRLRLKVHLTAETPVIDSVMTIWRCADWYEREAFDLFGILFRGHPDLRRILTDYGFVGHPFRKDFPLIGTVEMRYDETQKRVIYEPVSIDPRTLVPRVIRDDNRYRQEPN